MKKIIIGVMGPGAGATKKNVDLAYKIGTLIAQENWILLTGGRNKGVMDAASKGAKSAGGLTIGILPTSDQSTVSSYVDIPIFTEMKSARNAINVLSSKVIVACGIGTGTASEIALALKADKKVILIDQKKETVNFFRSIGKNKIIITKTPEETIKKMKDVLKNSNA